MSKVLSLGFGLRRLNNHQTLFVQSFRFYTSQQNKKRAPVSTFLEHKCRLPIHAQEAPDLRLASIICTIGPASRDVGTLVHMMAAGMRIARLNFSHGTHEYHAETIDIVREAVQVFSDQIGYNIPIAIALDTKGPEIRTGLVAGDPKGTINLEKGKTIKVTTNAEYRDKCSAEMLYVDYANITKIVKPDTRIFLDDGLISLKVTNVSDTEVTCEIENGGKLGSQKGANLPGTAVDLPAVSEKDKQDLRFGVDYCVDMIFASFIRDAKSVHEIRDVLGPEGQDIKIICKIENQQGLDNIDSIIEASDGIMMARGDLGIEIDPERVFATQKSIISKCNRVGKVAICATQMLESMTDRPRSTRAEAGDVANAILDGADCVMLSGETAKGKYPIECVETMSKICRYAQSTIWHRREFLDLAESAHYTQGKDNEMLKAMAMAAAFMTLQANIAAIVTIDCSGRIARYVSRFRPNCPIVAIMSDDLRARQAVLHRAVVPFFSADGPKNNPNELIKNTLNTLKDMIFLPNMANIITIYEEEFGVPESLILQTQTVC